MVVGVDVDAAVGDGDEDVVVDVAAGAGGVDGDVGAAAPPPLPPLLPPALSLLRGCQLVCNVQCRNFGAGASLSVCSALCARLGGRARTVREITSKISRRHEGMPRWARRPRRGRARARGELFAPFLRRVSSSAWYWSFCGCSRAGPARRRPAWTASPLRCKICRGSARRRELLRRAAEEAVARRVCLVLRVALISMRVVRCEVLVSVLCLWTRVQACSWRRAP